MTSSPDAVAEGVTQTLDINCTLLRPPASTLGTPMSLIVSKYVGNNNNTSSNNAYVEIASLAIGSPDVVAFKNGHNGGGLSGQGHLSSSGTSFLALQWKTPTRDARGRYLCQAYSMDSQGHPVATQTTVTVTEGDATGQIMQKLQQMEADQADLKSRLDKVAAENAKLKTCCSETNFRLGAARDALISVTSQDHLGRKYLLSHGVATDQATSNAFCQLFGGHLAEIDDDDEFHFVHDFLYNQNDNAGNNNAGGLWTMLGATDEGHEGVGQWEWLEFNTPMTSPHWMAGEPNGGTIENCLFIGPQGYIDKSCVNSGATRFLCEVPADVTNDVIGGLTKVNVAAKLPLGGSS